MVLSEDLLAQLHQLEIKVLPHLKESVLLSELCHTANMQEVEVMRACQWLENKKALSMVHQNTTEVHIDDNGKKALQNGMPELRFLKAVQEGARTNDEIIKKAHLEQQELSVSIGILKKNNWIHFHENKTISITKEGETVDTTQRPSLLERVEHQGISIATLSKKEQEELEILKKRKQYVLLKERKDRTIHLTTLGKELIRVDKKKFNFAERLTADDLKTGAWKEKKYRSYDVSINVPRKYAGKEHFVQEAIRYIQNIWVEMGFQEMQGSTVQTAFWDLDALFVPQDHPARETQDTFYLLHPERASISRPAFDRVREAHETGGMTGSKGWRYKFSKTQAEQLMLRTHTTVLSAQTLWSIKEGKEKMPGKYFVVGKVFRNESLDWKHLFEFHQVEGIVVDPNANFAQLITYLKIFFGKMGFPKIRLRPHHFPYTEPSVEVDVWNPAKQQWVELGGAGVFRPEVTKTLLGEEIPVLAWGLGLERIIVEYFGLTDLRDLYKNDVKQLKEMKLFIRLNESNGE